MSERSVLRDYRDRGYPMTYEALDAWYPSVPEADNAALVFQGALPLVRRTRQGASFWMIPDLGEAWSPMHRERAVELITANPRLFETLPKLAGVRESRFPIDLSDAMAGSTHLNDLKIAARLAHGDGLLAIEEGDSDRAIRRIGDLGRLGALTDDEPTLIAVLGACDVFGMQATLAEQAMTALEFGFDGFVRIAVASGSVDLVRMFRRGFIGSQAYYLDIEESGLYPLRARLARYSGERTRHLRWVLERVDSLAVESSGFQLADALDGWTIPKIPIYHTLNRKVGQYETSGRVLAKVASTIARRNAWELALAVERYRLDCGAIPRSLEALVPKYVAELPMDPFSREMMRYALGSEGCRIYSVGEDRVDDGGITRPANGRHDIVFRVLR